MFGMLVSKVPLPVQATLVPILTQLPLSLANMICTNVPGPPTPLYLLGHKLLRCYPYVPIGGELGINVAILSYNGVAYVGFGGDITAVPDIELFESMLRQSFDELREAAKSSVPAAREREASQKRTGPKPISQGTKPGRPKPAIRKIPLSLKTKTHKSASVRVTPTSQNGASSVEQPVSALAQAGD